MDTSEMDDLSSWDNISNAYLERSNSSKENEMATLDEINSIARQARHFRNKVTSILEFEEDRGKLFEALRAYHESRKVKRLVRDLKIILNNSKRYPLFKEIRSLIPQEHLFAYDKLTEGARTGERIIRVKRHGNESLGLKFKGGLEHGIGIYVTTVIHGSSAHASGIKVGDEILKVNGLTLQESIHEEVVNLFKDKNSVTLVVKNAGRIPNKVNNKIVWEEVDPQSHSEPPNILDKNLLHLATSAEKRQPVENRLTKDDRLLAFKVGKEGLGCSIRSGIPGFKGIYVSSVAKNSLAQQIGLKAGDQILDVNGKSFKAIKHSEAVEVLKSRMDLTMIVRHNKHVEDYFKRKKGGKEGQKGSVQPILKKETSPIRTKRHRANFGESLSIQVIDREPSDEEEEGDLDEPVINPSNLQYNADILQGKEVHLISIPKTAPLMVDLHQIRGRIVIVNVGKGGAAADHGFLRRGDYILNVEGTNLVGVTVPEAHDALNEAMRRLSLHIDLVVACTAGRIPPPQTDDATLQRPVTNFGNTLSANKPLTTSNFQVDTAEDLMGVRKTIAAFESLSTTDGRQPLLRRDSIEIMKNSLRLYHDKRKGEISADKIFTQQEEAATGSFLESSLRSLSSGSPPYSSRSFNSEEVQAQVHSFPPPGSLKQETPFYEIDGDSILDFSNASKEAQGLQPLIASVGNVKDQLSPANVTQKEDDQQQGLLPLPSSEHKFTKNEDEDKTDGFMLNDPPYATVNKNRLMFEQISSEARGLENSKDKRTKSNNKENILKPAQDAKRKVSDSETIPVYPSDYPKPITSSDRLQNDEIEDENPYAVISEARQNTFTKENRRLLAELQEEIESNMAQFSVSVTKSPVEVPDVNNNKTKRSEETKRVHFKDDFISDTKNKQVENSESETIPLAEEYRNKLIYSGDKKNSDFDKPSIPPPDYEKGLNNETYIGTDVPIKPALPKGSITSANIVQAALKKFSSGKSSFSSPSQNLENSEEEEKENTADKCTTVASDINIKEQPVAPQFSRPAFNVSSKLLSSAKEKLRRVSTKNDNPANSQGAGMSKKAGPKGVTFGKTPSSLQQTKNYDNVRDTSPNRLSLSSENVNKAQNSEEVKRPPSLPVMDQMMNELKDKMTGRAIWSKWKEKKSDTRESNYSNQIKANKEDNSQQENFKSDLKELKTEVDSKIDGRDWSSELGQLLPNQVNSQTSVENSNPTSSLDKDRTRSKGELERDSRIQRRQAASVEDVGGMALSNSALNETTRKSTSGTALDMEGTLREFDNVIQSLDDSN